MSKSNENGKILGTLIVGAVAGAVAGLLFAPQSGVDTRKELLEESRRLQQELAKYTTDFSDKASEIKQDLEARLRKTEHQLSEMERDFNA